jgi:Mor family transcriptional regulator
MPYLKADQILPKELIQEIQKYAQGVQIYIPRIEKSRLGWGQKNGTRKKLKIRNNQIKQLKKEGRKLEELADFYNLSIDSIRKIVYQSE